jgi:hypothetical protein
MISSAYMISYVDSNLGLSSALTKVPTTLAERHARHLRASLEKIARAQSLDPLSPQTWYNTSPTEIIARTQVRHELRM